MLKCNSCGSAVKYSIKDRKLKCVSCKSVYEVSDYFDKSDAETEDMNVFTCPDCAGEIYTTDDTIQGFCSFCGASVNLAQRAVSWKKPDKIIPFKITTQTAKEKFAEHLKSKHFLPKEFKNGVSNIGSFRGIYVPYYVYNTSGVFNVKHTAVRGTSEYTYTYEGAGDYSADINGITHDASITLADDIGDEIIPFPLNGAVDYNSAYLSGFYADLANITEDTYNTHVREDVTEFVKEKTKAIVAHRCDSNVVSTHVDTKKFNITDVKNYLMPIWFLAYKNGGYVAYAAVNGCTGEVVADTPVSVPKVALCTVLTSILAFIALEFVMTLSPDIACFIASGIMAFLLVTYYNISKILVEKNTTDEAKMSILNWKKYIRKKASLHNPLLIVGAIVSITTLLSGLLTVSGIVVNRNDFVYYGFLVAIIIVSICIMIKLIVKFKLLSMRKAPHFDYKGGNTNA